MTTLPRIALSLLALPATAQETANFEVLVVGTGHAPTMFLSEASTPAHLRAVLEQAAPDVVAVESHPEWFAHGRYHVVTYEAEGVAVPWARERGVPAYGVDWKDVDDWDRLEQLGALRDATTASPRTSSTPWSRTPASAWSWSSGPTTSPSSTRSSSASSQRPAEISASVKGTRKETRAGSGVLGGRCAPPPS